MTWNAAMDACCSYGFKSVAMETQMDVDCLYKALLGLLYHWPFLNYIFVRNSIVKTFFGQLLDVGNQLGPPERSKSRVVLDGNATQ